MSATIASRATPNEQRTLAAALSYRQRGWSVIPIEPSGKKPLLASWKEFQERLPSEEEIVSWWQEHPEANVGVVTGAVSGIVVLDIDSEEALQKVCQRNRVPLTPTAQTGGGGWHYFYQYPGAPARNKVGILNGVDVRGDGGYVVAPPSTHPSGGGYKWSVSPDEAAPAPLPEWLASALREPQSHLRAHQDRDRIPEGTRNNTLTSLAGAMRRKGMSGDGIEAALLAENNARCDPPLPEGEVKKIARSVGQYEPTASPAERRAYSSQNVHRQPTHPLPFGHDVPAWPEPVSGAEILASVEGLLNHYAILPKGASLVLALWAMSTWTIDAFEAHPYLAITSPEKRCGKSRVLELLHLLCYRPIAVANVSEAALFRMIEEYSPTLLIDEAQQLRTRDNRSAVLHDMVCAGFRRPLAVVHRIGGQNRDELRTFKVFCPKAFALIGRLTDVLADRSIEVRMQRRTAKEQIARFHFSRARSATQDLGRRLGRWAKDFLDRVRGVYHEIETPAALEDREAELWSPLFAVLTVADPGRLPELEDVAKRLAGAKVEEDSSFGVRLLQDIRANFVSGETFLPTATLLDRLKEVEDAPWSEWRHGKPLSSKGLADLLRPFGVQPAKGRHGEQAGIRGYQRHDLEEAWERYLGSKDTLNPPQAPQPLQGNGQRAISDAPQAPLVAAGETGGSASRTTLVAGVADESPDGRGPGEPRGDSPSFAQQARPGKAVAVVNEAAMGAAKSA